MWFEEPASNHSAPVSLQGLNLHCTLNHHHHHHQCYVADHHGIITIFMKYKLAICYPLSNCQNLWKFVKFEENFENWLSETLQIGLILLLSDNDYLVEIFFEIWLSEMLQIGLILLLSDNHYFTMVEENFEIWLSETLQIFFYVKIYIFFYSK